MQRCGSLKVQDMLGDFTGTEEANSRKVMIVQVVGALHNPRGCLSCCSNYRLASIQTTFWLLTVKCLKKETRFSNWRKSYLS